MCCNSFRILAMISLTAMAFIFNYYIPSVSVIYWYIGSINFFAFLVFSIDKFHAIKSRRRVNEYTLHFLSLAGGFIGSWIAMIATRHKIKKRKFLTIQILITTIWIAILYYINFQ